MVVRMRSTRSHTGNRRSHHALDAISSVLCPECGSPKLKHKLCPVCGKYKGKTVIDMDKKLAKKAKKAKASQEEKA